MKIYIAGKITGDPNYREKFDAVEKLLASQGYSVMNPARLGNYPGFSWEEYMGVSTSMQRICDAVVFLPDRKNEVFYDNEKESITVKMDGKKKIVNVEADSVKAVLVDIAVQFLAEL